MKNIKIIIGFILGVITSYIIGVNAFTIETNITQAIQYIKQFVVTSDGTNAGSVVVNIDGSSSKMSVSGEVIVSGNLSVYDIFLKKIIDGDNYKKQYLSVNSDGKIILKNLQGVGTLFDKSRYLSINTGAQTQITTNVINKLLAITGYYYKTTNNDFFDSSMTDYDTTLGVDPTYLKQNFSGLVVTTGGLSYIDYPRFTVILLQAIKELNTEKQNLSGSLSVLSGNLSTLKASFDILSGKVRNP